MAVNKTDHKNKVFILIKNDLIFILIIVEIKFVAPRIEEIPATWREKIEKSTEIVLCPVSNLSGGYIVHPVPVP